MATDKPKRGKKTRIEQLPEAIQDKVNELLRSGHSQKKILEQLEPLTTDIGEKPISAAGLNRYATKMAKFGARVQQSREIANMMVAKFGNKPTSEVSQLMIEMLRTYAFEFAVNADGKTDDEGKPVMDVQAINDLALAIQRLEKAAETSHKRERELRKVWQEETQQKLKESGKKAGLSDEAIELSLKIMKGEA